MLYFPFLLNLARHNWFYNHDTDIEKHLPLQQHEQNPFRHGILDLKGLNPSIFHSCYNYTNVDLVHHIYSFFHPFSMLSNHSTNTNSKYPFGLQVPWGICLCHSVEENFFHPSSTENSFIFIFLK